jgi:hypothetical protein
MSKESESTNKRLLGEMSNSTAKIENTAGWNVGGLRMLALHADCLPQQSLPCLLQDTVLQYFTIIQEYVFIFKLFSWLIPC